MADSELISIIVPVYNVAKYLPRCLESIVSQTYRNIDVVLVDDGSTDESGRLCDDIASADDRFSVIHKSNGGLSDARNAGLAAASGTWVFFLDSDDYISPFCIETMLEVALVSGAEIVECNFALVDDSACLEWAHPSGNYELYKQPEALERFLDYNDAWIMAWNKLYHINLFDGILFPIGKLHEDEFTTPYLVEKAQSYASLGDPLYAYVQREGSIMHSSLLEKRFDGLEALSQRLKYFSCLRNDRVDAINAYHLLAYCRSLESEYGDEMDEHHRQLISAAIARSLETRVTPLQGTTLFLKSILMRHLPHYALRLRKDAQ